jgi:hypothetical protein
MATLSEISPAIKSSSQTNHRSSIPRSKRATKVLTTINDPKQGPLILVQVVGLKKFKYPRWYHQIADRRDYNRPEWFDHPAKDGDSLVVEPYGLDLADLRDLVSFADRHSLDVSISAMTYHYPTRTVSICLTPRKGRA